MEVALMTEMMSGVEHAEDLNVVAGLDSLDEQLIGQLVDRAKSSGRRANSLSDLLYQGERGRPRARHTITKMTPTQQHLYTIFNLARYHPQR
jgi:hypothetical protein